MSEEEQIDIKEAVSQMTVENAIALSSAIIAWLSINVSPNVAAEIAAMAQRIEESWRADESE